MGIGGWVTIQLSTYWCSQIWNKTDLQPFLPITKELQRYITSWEALAQLCIILTVFQKCETRPGILNIQSGSDNTGAEANTNHGFSTTEILADIIKVVSIKQIQCNIIPNVHHIPGEKNIDADNLSRGKLSSFFDELRVNLNLNEIFDRTPFPKYINNLVQWDSEIHPLAKHCVFIFRFVLLGLFAPPFCLNFWLAHIPFLPQLSFPWLNEARYHCEKISLPEDTVHTTT